MPDKNLSRNVYIRQCMEKLILHAFIDSCFAKGFTVAVDNRAEDFTDAPYQGVHFTDATKAKKHCGATDEEYLYVYKDTKRQGWVFFVYGNDGPDVINDYTTSLDQLGVMQAADEVAEKLQENKFRLTLD